MSPDLGRAAFRIASFLVVVSAGLLLILDTDSAEFVVSAVTLVTGVVLGAVVIIVARRQAG